MATQTLEFSGATGLTLSCKLFSVGSDTVVDTQTATEKTNDINRYSVDFVDVPAGAYRLNAFVGATGGFANEVYDLTLTTATFLPRSEAEIDLTSVESVVWDADYADHTTAGTFGKLMDLLRKANRAIDGEVAGTPSVSGFDTNLSGYLNGAFDSELLVFVSGALEGEARPILSYSATNGRLTFEESWTAVPSASDEFVILPYHVHPVSEIASGVLSAGDVDGYSLEESLKICAAVLAGKVSGAGTQTITFRAADDSKDRVVATVAGEGNRTSVTIDVTG